MVRKDATMVGSAQVPAFAKEDLKGRIVWTRQSGNYLNGESVTGAAVLADQSGNVMYGARIRRPVSSSTISVVLRCHQQLQKIVLLRNALAGYLHWCLEATKHTMKYTATLCKAVKHAKELAPSAG
jgi:hypothetical protein